MLKKYSPLIPILFLCFVWVVFAYPYFFQGLVPFPSSYQVNHFHPWSLNQKNWGPVKNGAMPDIIDQIYPWRHFSIQELKDGRIPLWNPNSFSGNPHIANVQSAAFSPMNIIFFILPFLDAWSLLILLQPFIAAVGMYLLLRFYKISIPGSLLGSLSWMFCGFIVVWMAYGTLSMAIALLPFLLYSLNKYFMSKKIGWGLLSSFLVAFSFFSGHFQTSLYLFLVSLGYCLYLFLSTKQKLRAVVSVVFVLFGCVIAFIQILPAIQFYNLSPRSDIFLYSGGIPLQYLITIIAPDFFGNPVTRNDWYGYYAEWSSFIGIVPFLFSLFTLRRKNISVVFFFQILCFISLLFAIESPLLRVLGGLHIPVLSTSTPSRLIVILSFGLSVLAGFGYDVFRTAIVSRRLKESILYFSIPASFFILCWGIIFSGKFLSSDHMLVARNNLFLSSAIFFVVMIVAVLAYVMKKNVKFVALLLLIPILLAAFDSVRFASKWMPFDKRALVFQDVPVIAAMQENTGHGRVFGNLGAQVGTYYNLPIIEGYDPLYIDRYGEFIRTSATGKYSPSERSVVKIDRNGLFVKRVLNLLDVTLIYHPNADTFQSWAFPVWNDADFKLVYKDSLYSIYKNTAAISRPTLYFSFEVLTDKKKLLTRFYAKDFNYRKVLLLEEDPGITNFAAGKGSIKTLWETPTELRYTVRADHSGFLFLADNFYPGWRAYVNGKETKILRADYTFRAIIVPEGKSTVRFVYDQLF